VVRARHEQGVAREERAMVEKGQEAGVLEDDVAVRFAPRDPAERAACLDRSPPPSSLTLP